MKAVAADPAFPLAILALALAVVVAAHWVILARLVRRATPATTIVWGDGEFDEIPYRPEDVLVGVDVAPSTGREVAVVMVRQSDGNLHIVMAHERTADDE